MKNCSIKFEERRYYLICRDLPAMAAFIKDAHVLLPSYMSKPNSAAAPKEIRQRYCYCCYKSLTSCRLQRFVSSPGCSQPFLRDLSQDTTKRSFLTQEASVSFSSPGKVSQNNDPWWLSQRTKRSIRRSGESAAAALDETACQEVKVKIKVGPVGSLRERVYSFQKIFGPSSSLVVVTLPKPLGIVFVETPWRDGFGKHRVVVGELVIGGNAARAARVSQLFVGAPKNNVSSNLPLLNGGVMPGDILRATTTASVIVDFFGLRRPQRVMDLYMADGKPWGLTMRALNASFVADGELTLVFERRLKL